MKSSTKTILWILWIIGAALGGAGVFNRFATGHHDANYGSYIVWGLWVSAYIYYIGLSAGAFLLSSLAHFVDLDGPLLLSQDRTPGLRYEGTKILAPQAALWG